MLKLNFGWLAESRELNAGSVRVEPLGVDSGLLSSPRIHDDWFYPPLEPAWLSANDIGNKHISLAPWFALPQSHRMVLMQEDDEDLAIFLILMLGVLKGLQLVPEGWGHLYRTPLNPGKLVDVVACPSATERLLALAREFWLRTPAVRTWMLGAAHWHAFGPSYEHGFEQFGVAYSVLDTCWRLHVETSGRKGSIPHASRIIVLCEAYELAVPPWALLVGQASRLSTIRNEYFHESLWGGRPIGFGHPIDVPEIHLELYWFNTRLILAILGERSAYTKSEICYEAVLLT